MHINQIHFQASPGSNADQASRYFFLQRFLEKNEDLFERIDPSDNLNDRFHQLIHEERENVEGVLENFDKSISDIVKDLILPSDNLSFKIDRYIEFTSGINAWKYSGSKTNDDVLMFLSPSNNDGGPPRARNSSNKVKLFVVSNSASDGEKYVGFFVSELNEIQRMVGEYVNLDNLDSGGELIHRYFNNKVKDEGFVSWQKGSFQNDFEEEIYQTVQKFTSVSLPNVNVELEVGENPEYDTVALPAGEQGVKYAIEAKDYEKVEDEANGDVDSETYAPGNLRYRLITQPKEEAERSDLNLITIVNGIPEEKYDDLVRHARPSNVILLNDLNYESELKDALFTNALNSVKESSN